MLCDSVLLTKIFAFHFLCCCLFGPRFRTKIIWLSVFLLISHIWSFWLNFSAHNKNCLKYALIWVVVQSLCRLMASLICCLIFHNIFFLNFVLYWNTAFLSFGTNNFVNLSIMTKTIWNVKFLCEESDVVLSIKFTSGMNMELSIYKS